MRRLIYGVARGSAGGPRAIRAASVAHRPVGKGLPHNDPPSINKTAQFDNGVIRL